MADVAAMSENSVFQELQNAFGVRLFTITVQDMKAMLFRRLHTSDPVNYPLTDTKPLTMDDDWSRMVLVNRQTFVANSPADYAGLFADHALIASLGCGSVINIPVLDGTQVLGTVNALDREGFFGHDRVHWAQALVAERQSKLISALRAAVL